LFQDEKQNLNDIIRLSVPYSKGKERQMNFIFRSRSMRINNREIQRPEPEIERKRVENVGIFGRSVAKL
jgi:hypothetical protein